MGMNPEHDGPRDLLSGWEQQFDAGCLERVEQQLAERDDGEVVEVPHALAASLLGYLLTEIETDLETGRSTQQTHTRLVYAKYLDVCVHDRDRDAV